MDKIDVCINVFGKPFQTLVTLKSLLNKSGKYIDKIYFIEENQQPYQDHVKWIINELNYDKLVYFKPKHHLWINGTDINRYHNDYDYRNSLRYQYGLENTDKKYLLIIHNDVLFNSDILTPFINLIGDGFGIGQIGQCWNCPLFHDKKCDGNVFNDNLNIDFDSIKQSINNHPTTRTAIHRNIINPNQPMPMPECRINEWCCLIDMDKYRLEVLTNKRVRPFGGYFKIDLADAWFEDMYKIGYHATYYDIYKNISHGYFSTTRTVAEYSLNSHNGHSALFNQKLYELEESEAEIMYNKLKNK